MRTFIAVNGRCSRSSSYSGCDRGSGHANRASRSHPMPVTSSSLTRCPLSVHSPPSASPTGQSWAVLDFNRSDDEISGRFLTSFDEMRVPLLLQLITRQLPHNLRHRLLIAAAAPRHLFRCDINISQRKFSTLQYN